ncbi:MAG: hypothetical protein CMD35_01025 [Flavobacteriales bacterium]|nr:hypothetical protein [Flavobacteriales bacterium]|tara:strand:+ start:605 stop:1255 length:651 start_codon:yes stop_codon:yes gene_type:complete
MLTVLIVSSSYGQKFNYSSWSAYLQGSFLSNYKTIPVQPRGFLSGGIDYSSSYNKDINLKFGINYLETFINNDKKIHSICDQPDNSCWAESDMRYINLPVGIELYANKAKIQTKSYYGFRLIPMFSLQERLIKTEIFIDQDPDNILQIDTTTKNGFKFQDLHLEFTIGTEFSINEEFKFYFEPSVQHSALFRKEDLINPNYMISFRLGIRFRSHKQ